MRNSVPKSRGPHGDTGGGAVRRREHIEHGHGKEKVLEPDPAAAAIDTDAMTAGHGPMAREVDTAAKHEIWMPAEDRTGSIDDAHNGWVVLSSLQALLWIRRTLGGCGSCFPDLDRDVRL